MKMEAVPVWGSLQPRCLEYMVCHITIPCSSAYDQNWSNGAIFLNRILSNNKHQLWQNILWLSHVLGKIYVPFYYPELTISSGVKIKKLDTKTKWTRSLYVGTTDLSNDTKKRTTKSHETIPLRTVGFCVGLIIFGILLSFCFLTN
jgi:hypothetical protein